MSQSNLALLLLFLLNSSLASGQWESDQFLFGTQDSKLPRIQPNRPRSRVEEKKEDRQTKQFIEEKAALDEDTVSAVSDQRMPAGLRTSTSNLQVQLGYIDFRSRGDIAGMTFSQGSYSVGTALSLQVDTEQYVNLCYTTTPEIVVRGRSSEQWAQRLRWEDFKAEYFRRTEAFEREVAISVFLRQNAWWGRNYTSVASLRQLNSVGVGLAIPFHDQGLWQSSLQVRAAPWIASAARDFTGRSFAIDWLSFYPLGTDRSVMLNIGYEAVELRQSYENNSRLDQGLIKVYLGYRISTDFSMSSR